MKYGILRVGDTVKFTDEAKKRLGEFADDEEHIVTKITVDDGLDDWLEDINDVDTTGNEHAEWVGSSGADVYWLKLVKRNRKILEFNQFINILY